MDDFVKRIWNDKWREDEGEFRYNTDSTRREMADMQIGKTHDERVKEMQELMNRKRGIIAC